MKKYIFVNDVSLEMEMREDNTLFMIHIASSLITNGLVCVIAFSCDHYYLLTFNVYHMN